MGTLALAALALAGCATTSAAESASPSADPSMYGGGDGTRCAQAVVIHARDEKAGIRAESDWIAARYPGSEREAQGLMQCNGTPADRLRIRTAEGREVDLFFDISEYFGRM